MGIAGSLVVIIIAWWIAFVGMLSVGVRPQVEAGEITEGTDPGAPVAPKLGRKALWATLVALVVWVLLYGVVELGWLTLADLDFMPGPGVR